MNHQKRDEEEWDRSRVLDLVASAWMAAIESDQPLIYAIPLLALRTAIIDVGLREFMRSSHNCEPMAAEL